MSKFVEATGSSTQRQYSVVYFNLKTHQEHLQISRHKDKEPRLYIWREQLREQLRYGSMRIGFAPSQSQNTQRELLRHFPVS